MTIDEMKELALAVKEAFAELNLAVDDDRLARSVIEVNKASMWR